MTEIVGVRFKENGRIYSFDPSGEKYKKGTKVIVETARGIEHGDVAAENYMIEDEDVIQPLRKVLRAATEEDFEIIRANAEKEREALKICQQKILEHGLEMKAIDVECTFDRSKILFYFTADGRIDFRELVRDLASVFRTRIELRQVGVRDEAKLLGGLGICGRPFCCASFLDDFQPVSIKMAKEQNLSLNPTKISGTCGRLMCCLKYEQEAYEDLHKTTPSVNTIVETPDGEGTVIDVNLLRGKVKVRLDGEGELAQKVFDKCEVCPKGKGCARAQNVEREKEEVVEEKLTPPTEAKEPEPPAKVEKQVPKEGEERNRRPHYHRRRRPPQRRPQNNGGNTPNKGE